MVHQLKTPTILIAEDRAVDRGAIKHIFERAGKHYTFIEAVDGDEARAKAKIEKPNLIILDPQMPPAGDDEGLHVLEYLRANPETASIPVIAITHLGYEHLPKKYAEFGVKFFFRKWKNYEGLIAAVDQLVS